MLMNMTSAERCVLTSVPVECKLVLLTYIINKRRISHLLFYRTEDHWKKRTVYGRIKIVIVIVIERRLVCIMCYQNGSHLIFLSVGKVLSPGKVCHQVSQKNLVIWWLGNMLPSDDQEKWCHLVRKSAVIWWLEKVLTPGDQEKWWHLVIRKSADTWWSWKVLSFGNQENCYLSSGDQEKCCYLVT